MMRAVGNLLALAVLAVLLVVMTAGCAATVLTDPTIITVPAKRHEPPRQPTSTLPQVTP
jgi:hypothetical protein